MRERRRLWAGGRVHVYRAGDERRLMDHSDNYKSLEI